MEEKGPAGARSVRVGGEKTLAAEVGWVAAQSCRGVFWAGVNGGQNGSSGPRPEAGTKSTPCAESGATKSNQHSSSKAKTTMADALNT